MASGTDFDSKYSNSLIRNISWKCVDKLFGTTVIKRIQIRSENNKQ